nr:molybdopterin-binding protein [Nocardia puris]
MRRSPSRSPPAPHSPATIPPPWTATPSAGPGPWWTLRRDVHTAGIATGKHLAAGHAVRLATGAPTPLGATAVIRDEYAVTAKVSGQRVIMRAPGAPMRDDTRRRGEHWTTGQHLAPAGTRVCPAVVSAAAAAEVTALPVRGPVRANVLLTGDEIRTHGPLGDGQTRDALGPILPNYLRACDIRCDHIWHLDDDRDLLRSWFELSTDADLIVVAGATGRGAADHLRPLLAEAGARVLIDGVAMRPGGSHLVAVLPDGRVLLGLPGNPYAAVAALLLTGPALVDALTARTSRAPMWGRIAAGITGEITKVLPVRQVPGGVWRTAGPVQTPHLADLIGCSALAVLRPGTVRGSLAELLPLPR